MGCSMAWVIYETHLVPSKIRGQLPDIVYEYIANTSDIGYHFDFTKERKCAYVFDNEAYTVGEVKEMADLLCMKILELN